MISMIPVLVNISPVKVLFHENPYFKFQPLFSYQIKSAHILAVPHPVSYISVASCVPRQNVVLRKDLVKEKQLNMDPCRCLTPVSSVRASSKHLNTNPSVAPICCCHVLTFFYSVRECSAQGLLSSEIICSIYHGTPCSHNVGRCRRRLCLNTVILVINARK